MSRLLEALNDRQRAAVINTEGPLLVIAGAGSGKTRVLTHRLSYIISEGLARPWEVLAVTFTNKAAGEMKERISSLLGLDVSRMWVSTFHSFCARFLRMEAEHLGYPSNFTIHDDSDSKSLVSRCLKELGISGTQFTPASVLRKISSAKNLLYDAEKFASEAEGFYDERTAQVFTLYEQKLRASAAFDFDDLLSMAVKLLDEHDTVRNAWQNRFRYLLVDEYQDTNHAQYNLLKKLVNESNNICVVGDEDQSIYGWRGADISNILGFEEDFPGAEIVKLEQNYRSTQTILSAASAVIKNNSARKDKTLWTEIDGGEKITIALNETQSEEADWVIDRVLGQTDNYSLSDMVILYRTNAQSRSFEESLRRRNTPYQIIGGLSFYQRKEIKDLIAYMKLVSNPCDEASFVRIINFPKRALGDTSLAKLTEQAKRSGISLLQAASEAAGCETLGPRARKGFALFAELIAELKKQADTLPVDEFIQAVIDETALGDALVAEDPVSGEARLENMQEFISAAAEFFTSNPEPTLDNFLAEITLYAGTDSYQESDEKLTMMTLHNAKGLEFDAVFVTGMEDGLFPLARTFDDPNELEEERRLLYVGATRARKQLTLTMAHQRRRYNGNESPPSRFLKEIPPELVDKIDRRAYKWDFGPTRTTGPRRSAGKPIPDKKPAAIEGVYYEYEDDQGVRPGQTVLHPKFGHGRVIAVDGMGEDMRVDVDFASYGPKKLVAKYARLTVISK
ncbi:MAG: UvrD-helicase domain-containing protein [FCB group bacterium]|nr:UvrD-helicase domain-containing protein [FCB group bacterium]